MSNQIYTNRVYDCFLEREFPLHGNPFINSPPHDIKAKYKNNTHCTIGLTEPKIVTFDDVTSLSRPLISYQTPILESHAVNINHMCDKLNTHIIISPFSAMMS